MPQPSLGTLISFYMWGPGVAIRETLSEQLRIQTAFSELNAVSHPKGGRGGWDALALMNRK